MADKSLVVGVVSDTHGYLDEALLAQLEGSDLIVHAGDICSRTDYERLLKIAPVQACLGNNDSRSTYGGSLERMANFYAGGLHWLVCHYQERIDTRLCDVAICGHTHRPGIYRDERNTLIMNPGSPTYPRTAVGPTCGRIVIEDGQITEASIVQLDCERPSMWGW